jgi:hypothetical protein
MVSSMGRKKTRILVASVPQAYTRLFAVLSGHELSFARTLTEAQTALDRDGFDLVMVGVHFDESKMFELLQYVKADARYTQVPLVCFRGVAANDAKTELVEGSVEAACKAVNASFFDLTAFTDDNRGNSAVRKIIHDLLGSEIKAS